MPPHALAAVVALLATLAALLGTLARAWPARPREHSRCLARLACTAPSARKRYAAQLVRARSAQPLAARLRRSFRLWGLGREWEGGETQVGTAGFQTVLFR